MARSVLVVGAQGFLGSLLARAFADEGWRVTRAGRRPESGRTSGWSTSAKASRSVSSRSAIPGSMRSGPFSARGRS